MADADLLVRHATFQRRRQYRGYHGEPGWHSVFRAHWRLRGGHDSGQPDGRPRALLAPPGRFLVMPLVTLYTRAGCCLCDQAKAVLREARSRAAFQYEERDIDADP